MKLQNFIVDNLATIWQRSTTKNHIFGMQHNRNLADALSITTNNNGIKPDKLEHAHIANSLQEYVTKGWNINDVELSDKARLLAQTDKAMAEAMQNGYTYNTNHIANGKNFFPKVEFELNKYLPKPTKLPIYGQTFTMQTGAMLFEFTGSHQSLALHRKVIQDGGFSILNAAKDIATTDSRSHEQKMLEAKDILAGSQAKVSAGISKGFGKYAMFQHLSYKYSYNINPDTQEATKVELERNLGDNFIAKKIEIIDNVLDLSGVEYAYSDVFGNEETGEPYRLTKLEGQNIHDIARRLLNPASRELSDDENIAKMQYGTEFTGYDLQAIGLKEGEFTYIDKNGEIFKYMISSDGGIYTMEEYEKIVEIAGDEDITKITLQGRQIIKDLMADGSLNKNMIDNIHRNYIIDKK